MMMTEATISNYKGIKNCQVKDLRRVNLFIGKNDSGKSSILEAIFHTCRECVEPNLPVIMSRRTDVFTGGRELWYRYDTKSEINIGLRFPDGIIGLTARMVGDQIKTKLKVARIIAGGTTKKVAEVDGSIYNRRTLGIARHLPNLVDTLKNYIPSKQEELATYIRDVVFIDCRSKLNLSHVESKLGEIKLAGKDEEFGSILQNIYGKGREWEFLPHPDSPKEKRIAAKESGKRVFLSDFGDGFRYGLAICAIAMTVEGTAIFIEEIESHQHSGSLRQLIPNLIEISRKNNLQLFVSTQNYNAWSSFFHVAYKGDVKRRRKEFNNFIVERDVASGKVTAEPTSNVQRIVAELGRP